MNLEIDKTYRLRIQVGNEALSYTGKIISIDDDGFFSFIDKVGITLSYNSKFLISSEEVGQ